jgi:hypothetical protein
MSIHNFILKYYPSTIFHAPSDYVRSVYIQAHAAFFEESRPNDLVHQPELELVFLHSLFHNSGSLLASDRERSSRETYIIISLSRGYHRLDRDSTSSHVIGEKHEVLQGNRGERSTCSPEGVTTKGKCPSKIEGCEGRSDNVPISSTARMTKDRWHETNTVSKGCDETKYDNVIEISLFPSSIMHETDSEEE